MKNLVIENLENKNQVEKKEVYENINFFLNKFNNTLKNTSWEWKRYEKWSDYKKLINDVNWKNIWWFKFGDDIIESQLNRLNFMIYYSKDEKWDNIPRIIIKFLWDKIHEIRWIEQGENLDIYIANILNDKLEDFWNEKEKYKKYISDLEKINKIYNKYSNWKKLLKKELIFLYEIEDNINYFWEKKYSIINEIIKNRDIKEDLSYLFGCEKKYISLNKDEFLKSKDIIYHYWNLDLLEIKKLPDNFVFPKNIIWNLDLSNLEEIPRNCIFPENIKGNLYLTFLKKLSSNFRFPKEIWWSLYLSSLKNLRYKILLPKIIKWNLYLNNLEELPNKLNYLNKVWCIYLPSSITIPRNFNFSNIKII